MITYRIYHVHTPGIKGFTGVAFESLETAKKFVDKMNTIGSGFSLSPHLVATDLNSYVALGYQTVEEKLVILVNHIADKYISQGDYTYNSFRKLVCVINHLCRHSPKYVHEFITTNYMDLSNDIILCLAGVFQNYVRTEDLSFDLRSQRPPLSNDFVRCDIYGVFTHLFANFSPSNATIYVDNDTDIGLLYSEKFDGELKKLCIEINKNESYVLCNNTLDAFNACNKTVRKMVEKALTEYEIKELRRSQFKQEVSLLIYKIIVS